MEEADLWVGLVSGVLGIVAAAIATVRFAIPALARRSARFERLYDRMFKSAELEFEARWRAASIKLNAIAGDEARLVALLPGDMPLPELDDPGSDKHLSWLKELAISSRAAEIRSDPTLSNKSHGLLIGDLSAVGRRAPVRFVRTDYATVRAARETGRRPPILSAGGIVFCPSDRTVLLQYRSATAATYPHCLHLLGGNYEPATEESDEDDQYDAPLLQTAIREIGEESHLRGLNTHRAFISCAQEHSTGFVQFNLAGVSIAKRRKAEAYGSREGGVRFLTLDEVVELFASPPPSDQVGGRWVPSGALHMVAWLAMGAPDQYWQAPMRKEAISAYEAILPHLRQGLADVDGTALDKI